MNIFDRAKNIILKPSQTWQEIKDEEVSIAELYLSYAVILAAIPSIAQFLGNALIGYSMPGKHIRLGIGSAMLYSIVSYIMTLIGIYITAIISNFLAPKFQSKQNLTNAFKAVTYSMTPSWIAGIFYTIPQLSFLAGIISLYGIYLFYKGLPLLMDTPREKALFYVIAVILLTIFVYIFMVAITSALFVSSSAMRGIM